MATYTLTPAQLKGAGIYNSFEIPGGGVPSFSNLNSFSFDGIDDYFLGTSTYSELDSQTKATISFWIKPISGAPLYEFIASNGNQFSILIYEGHYIQMSLNYTVGQSISANISHITYGEWNHVCFCLDLDLPIGQEGKVFINGVDRTQTSATGTIPQLQNANGSLRLGESENFSYNPLNGKLDEFAIWKGTDQRANVSEIYGGGEAVDLNNLATAPQPTTWQRMGDNATWNGATWTMTDVNGGYTNRSINMVEANRTTDVPT